jgi:hypothetical protein
MSTNLDQDPTIVSDQYSVFESIIVEDIDQCEQFIRFYEDLINVLNEERYEPKDSFLAPRNDAVTGGLEFFIGFNFEKDEIEDSLEDLIKEFRTQREDTMEFTISDMTGRDKTLKVDSTNYEDYELGKEFDDYFR